MLAVPTGGAGGVPKTKPRPPKQIPGYTVEVDKYGTPIYTPIGTRPDPVAPTLPPAWSQPVIDPGFGGLTNPGQMQDAVEGQWDYGLYEQAMRNANISDDEQLEAARLRGESDLGRFMGDLTKSLGRQGAADIGRLGAAGRSRGGAALAMARARQEAFNKASTAESQTWLDKMAGLRSGVEGRRKERMVDFAGKAGDIAARLAQDPRYAQRDPVYGQKEDLRSLWNTMNDPRARMYFQNEIGMGYENWVRSRGGQF